ncbi:ABC transporter ATP-binding protein [Actinoplanes couchii]|uniref:ABC transporter n=1 Tax=Actinoplanes couchii TaxID=403638 RepID=A0ABQ3XMM6_9ACTN|nr:ABC transporter ATP-binding protein [Actinoplanes couchii]MDR6321660.1 ABC-type multidrug transport system fused ATPase/permease subunit [Actinoplanes couchii]GID59756.1 ABC transporter [Actinoplanes couchii]
MKRGPTLLALLRGARAHPGPASVATVTGLLNGATMVAGAAAVGWATDHVVIPALSGERVPPGDWWLSTLFVLGVSAVRWSTIFVRGVATGRVQYRAQADTRRAVAHRYLELDLPWFRHRSPGRLLAHAISDVDAQWSPMQFAFFACGMVFMLLLALTELFLRDVSLGLAGLALVVSVFTLTAVYQRLLTPRAREMQEARGLVAAVAHESIEAGPVVRSLGLIDAEDARFTANVQRLKRADMRMAAVSSVFDPLLELLPTATVLLVLAVSAPRVASGELSVGDLVGVIYLLITVSIPLNVISRFLSMLPMSGAGLERVRSVLDSTEVTAYGTADLPGDGPLRVATSTGLTLEPGTVTVVVGRVGSGKTTLLELAGGQRVPAGRTVCFDGVDVRYLARGVVAANVAVVSQDPFLFAESIRANLELSGHPSAEARDTAEVEEAAGRRPYDEGEIWGALELAAADEVVRELPGGLDTVVGERGATLSGGQRQRLCIARALLRRPRLLLLDDATSALDSRVEREVLGRIRDSGRTVLMTTNRPAAVAIADRVVLVEAGRIAATGSHEELMEIDEYRRLITAYEHGQEAAGDDRTQLAR